MKIALCQLGARLHFAAAECFHESGVLGRLYTDLYCSGPVRMSARMLAIMPPTRSIGNRLAARRSARLPDELVRQFPLLGVQYAARLRCARSREQQSGIFLWANRTFERRVLAAGFAGCDTVYGFNTAAAGIFAKAKESGLRCVLEQTIVPMETEDAILREEYRRAGIGWSQDGNLDEIVAREHREWALADLIVVGSAFVAQSVMHLGVPSEKVAVVPYGVDAATQADAEFERLPFDGRRPLQVVFAGNDMVRKGARYLVESARKMGPEHVSVKILGHVNDVERDWLGHAGNVHFAGSVNRPAVRSHFQTSDVFVLPSLCEGSATATYEALAAGLPVICTENTGSIVTNGHDGFIVPPQDTDAICAALKTLIDRPSLLEVMRANALLTARSYTVEAYGKRLMAALGRMP